VKELGEVRRAGLTKLRSTATASLQDCAERVSGSREPSGVEALLRRSVDRLEGGELGESASYLFGLEAGTRGRSPTELRRLAADRVYGISSENFRKLREPTVIRQVAEAILALCVDMNMRDEHAKLTERHPADTRLAVQWVDRFQDYYRLFYPASALATSLVKTRQAFLSNQSGKSENQRRSPQDSIVAALYFYASFHHEHKKWRLKYGGLYLFSSPTVELRIADAVYAICSLNSLTQRQDSLLRIAISNSDEEMEPFLNTLEATPDGQALVQEFANWCSTCHCVWREGSEIMGRSHHIPGEPGIALECQPHQVIQACDEFMALVDDDWAMIADWYKTPVPLTPYGGESRRWKASVD
jgi:hypothetical protein